MGKITDKRRVFIDQYFLCGFNATEAARRAGYKHPNTEGPRLMLDEDVRGIIEEKFKKIAMSADEVLARLTMQASGDYAPYILPDGTLDITSLVNDGKSYVVKEIAETKYGKVVKFHDVQSALAMLAKYHGLQRERVEHTGLDGGPIEHREIGDLSDDELGALREIAARHSKTD